MRIDNVNKSKGAVNLTNGKVPGLVPIYTGRYVNASSYSSYHYERSNTLNIDILSEIKRKTR